MPVVEGTGSSASVRGDRQLAKRIEAAMSDAVLVAQSKGITDPAEIKAAMMEARRRVLALAGRVPSDEAAAADPPASE